MRPSDSTPFELREEFKTVMCASLDDKLSFPVLGRVHIKLTKTKQKQIRNRTGTKVKLLSTNTSDKSQICSSCFSVLSCPHSAYSCSEVNTSCGSAKEMRKMRTYTWLRLALYSYIKKKIEKKGALLCQVNIE